MKIALILAFLLLSAEVEASNIFSRVTGHLTPKYNSKKIGERLQRVARSGKSLKIHKIMNLADKHGLTIYEADFNNALENVARSGNPKAINLVVELADKRQHPYYHFGTFDWMLVSAARSNNPEAINLVAELADKHRLEVSGKYFATAAENASEDADRQKINHIFTIATSRGVKFKADHFGSTGNHILWRAAKSGDPKTIALVVGLTTKHDVKIADEHFGEAMKIAAMMNYKAARQVVELVDEHGIKLNRKHFGEAMENVTMSTSFFKRATMEMLLEFADKQGIKFNADDFGGAMATAAMYGEADTVLELATEHGITLNRKHFVEAMEKTSHRYEALKETAKIATDYGITFNAEDFFAIMLKEITYNPDYISHINRLAVEYDIILEKKHISQLLAKALLIDSNSATPDHKAIKKEIERVIALTTSLGIEADAEYYSTAFANVRPEDHRLTAEQLKIINEVTIDYGIRLNAEDVQFSVEEDL